MYEQLEKIIKESNNIVFFGGAGVSTESGIPDFRSKNGLYNQHDVKFDKYQPEYLLSADCLNNKPEVFFEFYRQKIDTRNIEPNITHKVLAKMEAAGKLKAVVTQNVDGLHQKAGSRNVYEIHGTTLKNYCCDCGRKYPADYIFTHKAPVPVCEYCKGIIRPDVVLYGESLPDKAVNSAVAAILNADCLIIGGTSLQVYPANTYVSYFRGKHLVVINKEKLNIQLDESDLFIESTLGTVFAEIDKWI